MISGGHGATVDRNNQIFSTILQQVRNKGMRELLKYDDKINEAMRESEKITNEVQKIVQDEQSTDNKSKEAAFSNSTLQEQLLDLQSLSKMIHLIQNNNTRDLLATITALNSPDLRVGLQNMQQQQSESPIQSNIKIQQEMEEYWKKQVNDIKATADLRTQQYEKEVKISQALSSQLQKLQIENAEYKHQISDKERQIQQMQASYTSLQKDYAIMRENMVQMQQRLYNMNQQKIMPQDIGEQVQQPLYMSKQQNPNISQVVQGPEINDSKISDSEVTEREQILSQQVEGLKTSLEASFSVGARGIDKMMEKCDNGRYQHDWLFLKDLCTITSNVLEAGYKTRGIPDKVQKVFTVLSDNVGQVRGLDSMFDFNKLNAIKKEIGKEYCELINALSESMSSTDKLNGQHTSHLMASQVSSENIEQDPWKASRKALGKFSRSLSIALESIAIYQDFEQGSGMNK